MLPQITGKLSTCHIGATIQQAFPDLILADQRFFIDEKVDLVLGGDIYPQIIMSGIKKNALKTPLAQETIYGWILTGAADTALPKRMWYYFIMKYP